MSKCEEGCQNRKGAARRPSPIYCQQTTRGLPCGVKTETINVSLTPAQKEFVIRSVERDYGNVSEFFRDMLRERMEREVAADVALLDKAMRGAPDGDPSDKEMAEIVATQHRQRKERRARRL